MQLAAFQIVSHNRPFNLYGSPTRCLRTRTTALHANTEDTVAMCQARWRHGGGPRRGGIQAGRSFKVDIKPSNLPSSSTNSLQMDGGRRVSRLTSLQAPHGFLPGSAHKNHYLHPNLSSRYRVVSISQKSLPRRVSWLE